MRRRCQNLKLRTLHRLVGLDLELCLKFVLSKVFNFFKSFLMFSGPFKFILLSMECYGKVFRMIAFCKHIYLRNSTFQGILGFSFYL